MLVPDQNDRDTIQFCATTPYGEYRRAITETGNQWATGMTAYLEGGGAIETTQREDEVRRISVNHPCFLIRPSEVRRV